MSESANSNTKVGKGCGTIFFSIFALMGLFFFVAICKITWDRAREYTWKATDCTIVKSRLGTADKERTLEISYRYDFGGREFTGTRVKGSDNKFDNVRDAQRALQRYAEDTRAKCFVNDSVPEESVLEHESLWIALVVFFPLIFVAIGVGGIVAMWRTSSPRAKPVSERAATAFVHGKWIVAILGLVFTVIGGIAVYFVTFRVLGKVSASSRWTETPCVVTSSRVEYHRGDNSTTYSVDIHYRYEFGGHEYVGDQYNFSTGSSSNREWRDEVVRKHPPGTRTVCYVDPADPVESVLVRDAGVEVWFGFIPGVFILVGLGMLYGSTRMGAKGRGRSSDVAGLRAAGPAKLKAANSPLGGCIFISIFAAIWNGVVWAVFLTAKLTTFPKIFLGLFALLGLGLIAGVIHQFLSLFNPRPELMARAHEVPLGGMLEVDFRMTGSVRRIMHLRVVLEGREAATYRRGTTTSTDKSTFAEVVLLDTTNVSEMSGGTLNAAIPVNSMHSFDAANNKITWVVRVHGDIPKWPDINAEFPITVLPAARTA